MKARVLTRIVLILVLAMLAVPVAQAAPPQYDGYKSGYPQLHLILTGPGEYEGYKSGYPQLHQILTYRAVAVAAPAVSTSGKSFAWRDAGIGLLVGALGAGLVAASVSQLRRSRHTAVQ